MACRVVLGNGNACRAAPMRGTDYRFGHRHRWLADGSVSLVELSRLAQQFDQRSTDLCPASEFIAWLKPELSGLR